jgi:hypothetical protein
MKDEGVIFEQRQRVGSEFVQPGIPQNQWRLWAPRGLLLPQNVGNVVGAEGASGGSFFDGASHGFGTILADEFRYERSCAFAGSACGGFCETFRTAKLLKNYWTSPNQVRREPLR